MINKILVANRGEIAIRVMRACRELEISSVAIYSEADKDALFAEYATEAYFAGPAPAAESYLNIPTIIRIAKECGAQAIHPGYGFLSENAYFAEVCERDGMMSIGPSRKVLHFMGDKVIAREQMREDPASPSSRVPKALLRISNRPGLRHRSSAIPSSSKPTAGGGGKGMRIVDKEGELRGALVVAQNCAHRLRLRRCVH